MQITMDMTSCFLGYWVETTELQNYNSTVFADASPEDFLFVFGPSRNDTGALFSLTSASEPMKDTLKELKDSRYYRRSVPFMPAGNTFAYGSSPTSLNG